MQAPSDAASARRVADTDLVEIYQALKRGAGREHVDDGNVDALIAMAREYGDAQLELLLREWSRPCGDDNSNPVPPGTQPPES